MLGLKINEFVWLLSPLTIILEFQLRLCLQNLLTEAKSFQEKNSFSLKTLHNKINSSISIIISLCYDTTLRT